MSNCTWCDTEIRRNERRLVDEKTGEVQTLCEDCFVDYSQTEKLLIEEAIAEQELDRLRIEVQESVTRQLSVISERLDQRRENVKKIREAQASQDRDSGENPAPAEEPNAPASGELELVLPAISE